MLLKQLSTLAHGPRMDVFRLLMRRYPDVLSAGEIAQILNLKASTTSVYLSALHECGLINQNRSGNFLRYAVDLDGARAMVAHLLTDCCNGRPDLCPSPLLNLTQRHVSTTDTKQNVLFICTGNSARSIFAEALTHDEAGARFNAFSAGTVPQSELNPFVVEMLAQKGIGTGHLRAKNISEFQGDGAPVMDFVFTVCDHAANEECPAWSGQPISAHWGLPDPVRATGTDAEKRLAFQQTFGAMRNRILAFTALPMDTLSRASLQHEVDAIGRTKENA
ncbi:MAG: ArsR family transcriptional regulator [Pseudomonadota bacterium]